MKKIIFSFILLVAITANAQEKEYNQWSVEAEAGVHKPASPFSPGYYTSTPSLWQGGFGVRYMMNEKFGIKLDAGYNSIENHDDSQAFETKYFRTSLQGVVNMGNVLNFNSWTKTFNLLAHGGMGYSLNTPKSPNDFDKGDQMLNLIVGFTPQLKLSDRIALTGDLSMVNHIRQSVTWDGTQAVNGGGLNGKHMLVNASVGLTFYLGKNAIHADWYSEEDVIMSKLDSLDQRLSKVETDMNDSDNDGIANYLDQEPNTVANALVDSKGRAVDVNNDGIPDTMLAPLDARYASKGDTQGGNIIKELIDNGYVNVYFRFNSTTPEDYSLQSVNYLIIYMNENPGSKAELIGYADELGDASYNQKLSEKRAIKVQELLVAAGIDAARLTVRGGGEDASVDKNSTGARQLVRRVTFKLK
ncbi:MAG: cell envelope biogenesis protein OmpA [Flavobacteria bacterium RIFCSPLOWO2_12_FULL_35_11]|nr:MAG: cell envelope biogenesis protein OmpA [Flavobacteria bacterium RIFCSPLOWO2_12_FULL_35_11]